MHVSIWTEVALPLHFVGGGYRVGLLFPGDRGTRRPVTHKRKVRLTKGHKVKLACRRDGPKGRYCWLNGRLFAFAAARLYNLAYLYFIIFYYVLPFLKKNSLKMLYSNWELTGLITVEETGLVF